MDPTILKEGGLAALALGMAFWAWTLWLRIKELETLLAAVNARCLDCSKAHAERLLVLANSTVRALEQSTEAMATEQRQTEILKRLEDRQHGGPIKRKTGAEK